MLLIYLKMVFCVNIIQLAPIIVRIPHRIATTVTHTDCLGTSWGNFLRTLLPCQICLLTPLC